MKFLKINCCIMCYKNNCTFLIIKKAKQEKKRINKNKTNSLLIARFSGFSLAL